MKDDIMRHMPRRPHGSLSPITLRIADACRITGVGRSKFYELIKAGEIEVIKVGAVTLVPVSGIQTLLERGRSGARERAKPSLVESMHPFLANAILTASIAGTSESVRRDLASKDEETRTKAEDSIVERMIAALCEPHGEVLEAA
jgi:excisionase family DNA binding protein